MRKLKAVIVEDEDAPRNRIRRLLREWKEVVDVVAEASDGRMAVETLNALRPDVVFLDIKMPELDGFDVLEKVEGKPLVVFTTAYDQFAIRAFEAATVDYLVKPIEAPALERAIKKLTRFSGGGGGLTPQVIRSLIESMNAPPKYLRYLSCAIGPRRVFVKTPEIMYFQSQDRFTNVKTLNKKFITDATLSKLESQLDGDLFKRIHKGTIVNLDWIQETRRLEDGVVQVVMRDYPPSLLRASRKYAHLLKENL